MGKYRQQCTNDVHRDDVNRKKRMMLSMFALFIIAMVIPNIHNARNTTAGRFFIFPLKHQMMTMMSRTLTFQEAI